MTERREAQLDVEATELCKLIDQLEEDIILRNELKIAVLRFCSHAVGYLKEDFVVSMPKETGEYPNVDKDRHPSEWEGLMKVADGLDPSELHPEMGGTE